MLIPAVETKGLSRRFGFHYALRDVTLSLAPSSILLIIGPNGAGKTTLLRLLATALRPTRGRGAIFGFDLIRQADEVRRVAVYVGAGGGAYGSLSGEQNLTFAAAMSSVRAGRTDIMAVLERVGLARAAARPVSTYSQGMRRRLALARAWLLKPRLLLLDDPFGGLDADGTAVVSALVSAVRASGGAAVLAAHERERQLPLADHVVELAEGRQVDAVNGPSLSTPRARTLVGDPT